MTDIFETIAARAAAVERPGDFRRDGLLYCGTCGAPKECRVPLLGEPRVVGCMCACQTAEWEAEQAEAKAREARIKARRWRQAGIADAALTSCRFESAQPTPELAKCRAYVDRWEDMKAGNNGLLFWGNTGNGKTYAAACIANALIDRGVRAIVTSFPRILGLDLAAQRALLEQVRTVPLLVLDDLGAERNTEYSLEQVYKLVDERYKSGKPLIATTNLTLKDLCHPADMDHQRVYDRVLEMCVPVAFTGDSRRRPRAQEKKRAAEALFREGNE